MEDRRFGVQQNQGAYSTTEKGRATGISADAMNVLRNTYMLLGMTLAFSALTAFLNMNGTHPGFLITIVGYIGLLFATYKLKNSPWGIVTTFALTGFMISFPRWLLQQLLRTPVLNPCKDLNLLILKSNFQFLHQCS